MGEFNSELAASLRRAVEASPEDAALRLHLAELLLGAGDYSAAITEANHVLRTDPTHAAAVSVLSRTLAAMTAGAPGPREDGPGTAEPVQAEQDDAGPGAPPPPPEAGFDWTTAEKELGPGLPPPFVEPKRVQMGNGDGDAVPIVEPGAPPITLDDVGGLYDVKVRLNESFLAPMRHAEVARAFGKSLRGGLLLYGPPGCGKTFLARAVAGELGAVFMAVSITDIVDSFMGQTEKNLKAVFDSARAHSPTVLFFDEVDAIGVKRSSLLGSSVWLRQMVNQFLMELDSMSGNNDGLYVLAATNHPWDLDEALLRPGRLDRSVLVIPPDPPARRAILEYHLKDRPLAGINLAEITARTDGFSGADLQHLCITAAEKAMMQSIELGGIHPVGMEHINAAFEEVRPSTLGWLESAVNVVKFGNRHGQYNDLAEYLRSRHLL